MNKKIIGISLFILIITSSIFGCSKFQENNDTNLNSIDKVITTENQCFNN